MEILVVLGLILLNGLFAMSEIALVTARRARLQLLVDQGDHRAAAALALNEAPTRFLSTIQIGITSVGILSGIFGQAALATPLEQLLVDVGAERQIVSPLATALVVVVITYLSIVIGELVPERLGQLHPESIARFVAFPMRWLSMAVRPFVVLLTASTELMLRLIGIVESRAPSVTEEEIHAMLAEGSETGVIERHEHEMVRNVFRLDDRQIGSLMVPRSDVVALDADAPLDDNLQRIAESDHSRFPVYRDDLRTLLGITTAKQLLIQMIRGEKVDPTHALQPAVYVPETLTGMELLENFRASGVQMVFVVDEYGEVLGMVTLQDVLEAITGEFKPQRAEDAWAIQRDDGSWLLDGLIPVPELKDRLQIDIVPEEDRGRYNTLSGMMMLLLGRLPSVGDRAEWAGWRLEIVDIDGKRIDKVLASRLPEPETSDPEA